jgi:hypothetical protein
MLTTGTMQGEMSVQTRGTAPRFSFSPTPKQYREFNPAVLITENTIRRQPYNAESIWVYNEANVGFAPPPWWASSDGRLDKHVVTREWLTPLARVMHVDALTAGYTTEAALRLALSIGLDLVQSTLLSPFVVVDPDTPLKHACMLADPTRVMQHDNLFIDQRMKKKKKDSNSFYLRLHVNSKKRQEYAHRVLCWAWHGPPPGGWDGENYLVSHKCHNKSCLNGLHLSWADPITNRDRG